MGFLDKIREKKQTKMAHEHDHHEHEHVDHHAKEGTPGAEWDPVCKMWVNPKTAPWKSEHGGTTTYFCSPGCKKAFDKDPLKYLGSHSH